MQSPCQQPPLRGLVGLRNATDTHAVPATATPSGLLTSLDASHTLLLRTICHQVTQPASPSTAICGTAWPASSADGKPLGTRRGFDAVPLPSWRLPFFVTDKGLWRPEVERKSFTYPAKDSAPWRLLHPRSRVCPGDRGLIGLKRCVSCWARTGPMPLRQARQSQRSPVYARPAARPCGRWRGASRWPGRVLPRRRSAEAPPETQRRARSALARGFVCTFLLHKRCCAASAPLLFVSSQAPRAAGAV